MSASRRNRRVVALTAGGLIVLALLLSGGRSYPLLATPSSSSVPAGVYVLEYWSAWKRGSLVVFRPPTTALSMRSGSAHEDTPLWMKRVVATAGDRVCATENGIWINGIRSVGAAAPAQAPGRPALRGCEQISAGMVYLAGDGPRSLDSRYWGPIPAERIVAPTRLVF